ncbi:MAG: hypothetical protein E7081_04245 [Bacteroidales bacterium]|nr:hypothetical protein [Bacteroidales bacterium]
MTLTFITLHNNNKHILYKVICSTVIFVLLSTFNVFSNSPRLPVLKNSPQRFKYEESSDSLSISQSFLYDDYELKSHDSITTTVVDSANLINTKLHIPSPDSIIEEWVEREVTFNPNPTRAVWLSALFPGLGQIYNRRYWKLPILVGGFMGLGYATTWNNGMLKDYTQAYRDIMDSDPSTNSYMDFFPNNTQESSLDKTWLTNVLKSRKDYYRRNRDLCVICMVGVYLIAMVDAYVDASLSHFDVTPDLSVDVAPAIFQDSHNRLPSLGVQWAINF